jgi:fucose permease
MLALELFISTTAALIMLIFHQNGTVMWVGTMIYGFGMSAIFPTVMNLAN